jgi:hypothetical protein
MACQMIDAQHLPIILPEVEKYLPTRRFTTIRKCCGMGLGYNS